MGSAFSCVIRTDQPAEALIQEGATLTLETSLGLRNEGNRLVFIFERGSGALAVVGWADASWEETAPNVRVSMAQNARAALKGETQSSRGTFTLLSVELLQITSPANSAWIHEKGPVVPAFLGDTHCELRQLVGEDFALIRGLFAEAPLRPHGAETAPAQSAEAGSQNVDTPGGAAQDATVAGLLSACKLSASALQIVRRALAKRLTPADRLQTSAVLAAILDQGTRDTGAKLFGASAILGRLARERGGEKLTAWLQRYTVDEAWSDPEGALASPNVAAVFARAAGLVSEVGTNDNVIAMRHLVVALLDFPGSRTSGAHAALAEAGVDPAQLRAAFVESLAESGPEEERRHWGEQVERSRPPVRRRAGFNADLSTGEDQLGVQADVEAMAALIASVELQPPLSIGLFGNWGSGKSFFMEKLREALARLTRTDSAAGSNGAPKDFWPNIVPIEFNAWHYIDANLWASLVSHIFEQLRQWKQPGEAKRLQEARSESLKNLKLAQEARSVAVKHEEDARRALDDALTARDTAAGKLTAAQARLAGHIAKDIWTAVRELPSDLTKDARQELVALGFASKATADSVQSLYARLNEFVHSGTRLRAVGLALMRGHGSRVGLLLLVLSILVAVGAGALMMQYSEHLAPLVAGVTQLAGVATAAVAWVRSAADRVGRALEPIEKARLEIETRVKIAEEEMATKRAKLESEVEQRKAEVQQAAESVAVANRALQAAKAEVVDAYSGRYVTKFIEQRAASADYRKHLGLVALIREDFGRLSTLIIDHNRTRTSSTKPLIEAGENVAAAVARAGDLGVNRIVLFIDDLDRCPSDRVVEVLQAIHLLLAFPLFVVIVGVDSRWVTRALIDTHPTLFGRNKDGEVVSQEGLDESLATPGDYLEKIFQIPYRLRDLDSSGCRNLLLELTKADVPAKETGGREPGRIEKRDESPASRASTPTSTDRQRAEAAQARSTPGHVEAGRPITAVPLPGVEALRLSKREQDAMSELAPIIGRTPRATKRFVNTYRLLRATDPRLRYDFRGTMLLLAMVTGMGSVAEEVIHALQAGSPQRTMEEMWNAILARPGNPSEAARLREFLASEKSPPWRKLTVGDLRAASDRVAQFSFVDLDEPAAASAGQASGEPELRQRS